MIPPTTRKGWGVGIRKISRIPPMGKGNRTMAFPMERESDGIERPIFAPVATMRPEVKYTDHGRVMAGGRVHRVNYTDTHPYSGRFMGFLFVTDDGTLYATPDQVSEGRYHAMRWVGGFRTRMECVAFLRATQYVTAEWWKEAAREYAQAASEDV